MTALAIVGMHRSGTSLVARSLRAAGVYLGDDADLIPPAPDNPEGFFEHAGFQRLDDDLLEATGGAWDHVPPCPPMAADDPRVAGLHDRAVDLVESLAIAPVWGWKDPRACLTIRFWLDLVEDLRVVVCVRHPIEVALSLKRRNQTSYAHGLALWHAYYESLIAAVPDESRIVTHYDTWFTEPVAEAERLAGFAGLPAGAPSEVAPHLRHHEVRVSLAEAGIDPSTIRLYEQLCEAAAHAVDASPTPSAPARADRVALDLVFAGEQLAMRDRQVASLQRTEAELTARIADLEAVGRGEVLAELVARIDGLEATLHDVRYATENLGGRADAGVVRACRDLVRRHLPPAAEVLVVAKGDPVLLDLYGRGTVNFPVDESGRYPGFSFAHSIAAIAHLEAARARGAGYLLLPDTAAWWREHYPGFLAHLVEQYDVVADEDGAGLLVDIRQPAPRADGTTPRAVAELVDRAAAGHGIEPSILDWTGRRLAALLPGRNVFEPPPGTALPYLDGTVDIVLVADDEQLAEARRVACRAVGVVSGERLPRLAAVDMLGACDVDDAGLEVVALLDKASVDTDLVAVVEDGVVPLPGIARAVRATLAAHDRVGAVVPKLLAADGSLAAAGTTVFADGTAAGVAASSHQVVAPWHDYLRPTCGGDGIVVLTAAAIEKLGDRLTGPPLAWGAAVWSLGLRVVYQPDAVAVRTEAAALATPATTAAVVDAWRPVLARRPGRPASLDDAAWRALLATDDIEASWA